MSIVNALIIKNRKMQFISSHYRKILELLQSKTLKPKKFLDSGYIIIDFDNKLVFDCQDCFSLLDIKKGELKNKLKEMTIYFCPK